MPIDAPGSLTSDDYYALVAFLLDESGITSIGCSTPTAPRA